MHVFDANLKKLMEYDFSSEIEEKNYAFENFTISKDQQQLYLKAKAYSKKYCFESPNVNFNMSCYKSHPKVENCKPLRTQRNFRKL